MGNLHVDLFSFFLKLFFTKLLDITENWPPISGYAKQCPFHSWWALARGLSKNWGP